MLISTKQKHNILKSQNKDLVLKIRDDELEVVKKTKYLGVQSTAPWIEKKKLGVNFRVLSVPRLHFDF